MSSGASGSKARRTARLTWRMRLAESARSRRSPRRDFLSVVMKWPFSQEGPGSPVSPASNRKVVGPFAPWLPKGTIRTESTRSLKLRASSETTSTQWRTGGLPSIAVQISPPAGRSARLIGSDRVIRPGLSSKFDFTFRFVAGRVTRTEQFGSTIPNSGAGFTASRFGESDGATPIQLRESDIPRPRRSSRLPGMLG